MKSRNWLTPLISLIIIGAWSINSFGQETVNKKPQTNKWEIIASAKFLVGASSPIPPPTQVRAVYTWYPKLNPWIGITIIRNLNGIFQDWALYSGVNCNFRGMEATTKIENLTIKMGTGDDRIEGQFFGDNLSMIRNGYLSFPFGISYKLPNKKFSIQSGFYLSLLLQGSFKTIIDGRLKAKGTTEPIPLDLVHLDFSDKLKPFDFGMNLNFSYFPWERIGFIGGLDFGFIPIVRKDFDAIPFKLHNIYASVGISYRLSNN